MTDIKEFSLIQLQDNLGAAGFPPFHARQVFSWIYKRGAIEFAMMSDLPLGLRQQLAKNFTVTTLKLKKTLESGDSTKKLLFRTLDAYFIEGVLIPTTGRITGCVSTQVGCKYSCSFCASGMLGFKRNLGTGEILDQILFLKNNSPAALTHIVFMGTGEPLDNYDHLLKAVRLINSKDGFNIGARRITISTSGLIPGIERLAREKLQVELSVSLHAADEQLRSSLMPINRKFPLSSLMRSVRGYIQKTNRQVTFEYILIKGINSDLKSAQKLVKLLRGMICKVNLIPANPLGERKVDPAAKEEILLFKNTLLKGGIPVTLRRSRGEDIAAACGQLRLGYEKDK